MKGLRTLRGSRRRGGIASEACRGIAGGLPDRGMRRHGLRQASKRAAVGRRSGLRGAPTWAAVSVDMGCGSAPTWAAAGVEASRSGVPAWAGQASKNLLGGFEAMIVNAVIGGF